MALSIQEVAARCLQDPFYTRWILESDACPQVRAAILADLQAGGEVQGFFNVLTGLSGRTQTFVVGVQSSWRRWNGLAPTNLARLAGIESPSTVMETRGGEA